MKTVLLLLLLGVGVGEGSELCSIEERQLSESEFVNKEKTIGRGGNWWVGWGVNFAALTKEKSQSKDCGCS